MKKLLILLTALLFLSSCRYIQTKESYLDANASPKLKINDEFDSPNANSTLEVPEANSKEKISEIVDSSPPDMPIRQKQSDDGSIKIENKEGLPVLTAKTSKETIWAVMNNLELENWSIAKTDKDTCTVQYTYNDQDAKERENAGFIKKVFTRDNAYTDYSGKYNLVCKQLGSVSVVKFTKENGNAARTFLSDNVMNKLYAKLKP